MIRFGGTLLAAVLGSAALAGPAGAADGFGLKDLAIAFRHADASPARQAGSHPFEMKASVAVNTAGGPGKGELPIDAARNIITYLPPGVIGDPHATPRCSGADFVDTFDNLPACSSSSAIGLVDLRIGITEPESFRSSLYNLEPPPGAAAMLGFIALGGVPVTLKVGVNPNPPYNVVASATNIAQPIRFYGAELTIWGTPANSAHDAVRGSCVGGCPANIPERPFLTLPRSCPADSLSTRIDTSSWQNPGVWLSYAVVTPSTVGCTRLGFTPRMSIQLSTNHADGPTGLDASIDFNDEGLRNPEGIAQSDTKKVVVTLPEGVTANPSLAEGLAACSEADLARETADSEPGDGCPEASNIGRVEVETPILDGKVLRGQLFIASQHENPFGSLLALYMVVKDPELGILVKVPGKVEPDPRTGQLTTTFGETPYELPQFPLGTVRVHLREGGRSPLISPPVCGNFEARAVFTPWSDPTRTVASAIPLRINRGVAGGDCPSGIRPFAPGLVAGTVNNNAASFSAFYLRLTRRDGDQDITRFSAALPPGVVAKLSSATRCPEAAIAAAKGRAGRAERAAPSCPASSEIGRVVAGAGAGSQLTYVSGKLYLAGRVGNAPLSVVAIVPAVAGPFDVGTVVVRQALTIHSRTAEVRVDGAASDPIPHILAGIPLRVRDIRAHVDRPEFTLNPTSCNPFEITAEIWGGGVDVFSAADDSPVSRAERFQAANCARLGFKPRIGLRLKGGTRRGDHPALRGVYRPRQGDANLSRLVLRLPRSAFLDQGHIRTICTRVQFAGDRCPKGAIYGHAAVFTPLLDKPLKGPVYLRSSNNELPDLVADLHGLVDIETVARIDSHRGGIRATFTRTPDAPVSKVVVNLPGGKKGLVVNSRNLCSRRSRADADLSAHNGRRRGLHPVVRAQCKRAGKPKRRR
jgi:hypothetical protein